MLFQDENEQDISIGLKPGSIFVVPVDGRHSFFTDDESMDVIVYHPDSDSGPHDDDHPMVNKTLVNGYFGRKNTSS